MTQSAQHSGWCHVRLLSMAAALVMAVPSAVAAQQYVPAAGVTTRDGPPASRQSVAAAGRTAMLAPRWVEESRGGRVLEHTALGTLVGAAAAVLAVFVHTQTGDYSDHSLDGVAYLVAVPVGAAAGAVVGTIVGIVRTR